MTNTKDPQPDNSDSNSSINSNSSKHTINAGDEPENIRLVGSIDSNDWIYEVLNQFANHELQVTGGAYLNDDPALSISQAKAAIESLMLDVIGEDELPQEDLAFGETDKQEFERYGRNDLRAIQRQRLKQALAPTNPQTQQDLIDFVRDPENIKQAVEGSMEKRQAVIASAQHLKKGCGQDRKGSGGVAN